MRFIKMLDLKFPDPEMETEYTSIKNQTAKRDFRVTMIIIILVTTVVFVERLIKSDKAEVIIAGVTIFGFFILLYIGRFFNQNTVGYLTLFGMFVYNIYRLIITQGVYATIVRANLFFGGYTYAIFHMALISGIPGNYYKIIAVMAVYILRFGVFIGWMDHYALQAGSLIRGVLVDIFILYYYYSKEKTERNVFKIFYDNRKQLEKFKELLGDSLPLSVTVIDSQTGKFLFSNKTFSVMFDQEQSDCPFQNIPNATDSSLIPANHMNSNHSTNKPNINFLCVDHSTFRETESQPLNLRTLNFSNSCSYLIEIIQEFIKKNILNEKPLSLTASCFQQSQKRSFDVILKRITWNSTDALAIILNEITYQESILTLKAANIYKDRVIATVSHELRTPLNGIIGLIKMAEKNVTHSKALEYLTLSKDNANLLLNVVNSHLDLQQVNAGKLRLNLSRVNLRKVLKDITRLFQFQTSQKGIYLDFEIEKGMSRRIITDENRLKQILINLIGNAIKFTTSGGIKIKISSAETKKRLKISVVDTGIGIKEGDKGKLFAIYEKLEEGRNLNKNGVGLGLVISNILAALLNGKPDERGIEVISQQGVGSIFSFNILEDLKGVADSESGLNNLGNSGAENKDQNFNFKECDKKEDFLEEQGDSTPSESSDESLVPINSKIVNYTSIKTITNDIHDLGLRQKLYKSCVHEGLHFEKKKLKSHSAIKLTNQSDLKRLTELEENESHSHVAVNIPEPVPQKYFILVVDDNPFNLLVAENLIKESGYLVKTALGGREAIEIVKSMTLEGKLLKVILMDCLMPEMDGYTTSKILKDMMEKKEIQQVPILALTANSYNEEEIKKCFEYGMKGYLTKPISSATLTKALSKLE